MQYSFVFAALVGAVAAATNGTFVTPIVRPNTNGAPSATATSSSCEQVYNSCVVAGNGSPNLAACATSSYSCALTAMPTLTATGSGARSGAASPSGTEDIYTTRVVSVITTYLPTATTLTIGSSTIPVTGATTLTIVCPGGCTITSAIARPTTVGDATAPGGSPISIGAAAIFKPTIALLVLLGGAVVLL